MKAQERHQFALFVTALDDSAVGQHYMIKDADLVHRIVHVLRLQVGNELTLFDRDNYLLIKIDSIKKSSLVAQILAKNANLPLKPYVKLLLPILKKEALTQAIYNAVEAGANEIQLIATHKTVSNMAVHDLERLERVAIAAAEQSKHFSVPIIQTPIAFDQVIALKNSVGIFFDPTGSAVTQLQPSVTSNQIVHLLVGPEGDLTHEEKEQLRSAGWIFCALTPTILRASQAVSVGLGIWRSLLR